MQNKKINKYITSNPTVLRFSFEFKILFQIIYLLLIKLFKKSIYFLTYLNTSKKKIYKINRSPCMHIHTQTYFLSPPPSYRYSTRIDKNRNSYN